MAQTANYGFEKPSTDKNVDEEFYQLQETLDLLDAILAALQTAVNGKSAVGHTHAISDIVNLAAELAAKMPASQTFKLDDLTDVDGADGAPNGYVLVKSALGWLPSSALAALGTHGHLISEITGLVDALAGKADAATAVRVNAAQSFTAAQQGQARANIGNAHEPMVDQDLTGLSFLDLLIPSGYPAFRLILTNVNTTASTTINMRTSTDGGASFHAGAGDYSVSNFQFSGATSVPASASADALPLTGTLVAVSPRMFGEFLIDPGDSNNWPGVHGSAVYRDTVPAQRTVIQSNRRLAVGRINAARVFLGAGSFTSGKLTLIGVR